MQENGQSDAKAEQSHAAPILDCCWHVVGRYTRLSSSLSQLSPLSPLQDGTKVFTASCDKTCKMWDLQTNQSTTVAEHSAPVKNVAWIQAPNYSCVVTASWDKTLKV